MKKKKGFTLIELMIVVAIIGVLAAVAIPSFMRFINESKTSEVPINFRAIANGAISWWNAEHTDSAGNPIQQHFPHNGSPQGTPSRPVGGTVVYTSPVYYPTTTAAACGTRFEKNSGAWNVEPFLSLKFSINKSHLFNYSYAYNHYSNPAFDRFYLNARADLDCDGTNMQFNQVSFMDSTTHTPTLSQLRISVED